MAIKMRLEMKSKSQRYNLNSPRPRHGHIYTNCKMCFSIMMVICIKQHLSNIWSSIYEKVKQYWGWVEKKKRFIAKKAYSPWTSFCINTPWLKSILDYRHRIL